MENTILHGDCLELMKDIASGTVDMILADLPFGKTASDWDIPIDMALLWKEYARIARPTTPILLFGVQPFVSYLVSSNYDQYRYSWYWQKNQKTNFYLAKKMPLREIEEIAVFYTKQPSYFPQKTQGHIPTSSARGTSDGRVYRQKNVRNDPGGKTDRYPSELLQFKCVDNYHRLHPNQKPVDLCEYLIKSYTTEGQLVLDNTCGTGTTCLAARNLGRRFIGMELEEKYAEIARNRLA